MFLNADSCVPLAEEIQEVSARVKNLDFVHPPSDHLFPGTDSVSVPL